MAYFKIFRGTQAEVNAQSIVDGQMLYTTDLEGGNSLQIDVGTSRKLVVPENVDQKIEETGTKIDELEGYLDGFELQLAQIANEKADKITTNSLQGQINAAVLNAGDSSVEAAQARVNKNGTTFTTLKGHLDSIENTIDNQLLDKDMTFTRFNSRYPQNTAGAFRGFATRIDNNYKKINKVIICTTFSNTFTGDCTFEIYDDTFTNKILTKTIHSSDISSNILTETIYNIEINIDKYINFADYNYLYIAFTAPTGIAIQITNYLDENGATVTYKNKYMTVEGTTWTNVSDAAYNRYGLCLRVYGDKNEVKYSNIDGVSAVIGNISENKIGKYDTLLTERKNTSRSCITPYTFVTSPLSITPSGKCNLDNCIIKTLKMCGLIAHTATFYVGTIDQNNLLVSRYSFTVNITVGDVIYDLSALGYTINYGERLVYSGTYGNIVIYTSVLNGTYDTESVLITDSNHVLTGNYTGNYYFALSNVMCPFSYVVQKQSIDDRFDDIKTDLTYVKNTVNSISVSAKNYIIRPDGVKVVARVDNNNNAVFGYYYPRKVFVIGNSLTLGNHPTDDSSIASSFGMCASDYTKDWIYLTQQYLSALYSGVTIDKIIGTSWEGKTLSADRQAQVQSYAESISADADLIIIQLGDNCNTDAKIATLQEDATYMLQYLRGQFPNALVLWIGCWFYTTDKITKITNACNASGALFCNITALNVDANKGHVGQVITYKNGTTYTLTSADTGVISHPGDNGMIAIKDAVVTTLNLT